jgi:nicotinamide-nucleotide adenylyltransferase
MNEVGVVHGRFQVLHNDHLKYVLAGKARCRHLVVGITNPDPMLTQEDAAAPHRSAPLMNPLTFFERYIMTRAVLLDEGVACKNYSVVPLPINFPHLYRYYVPLDAVFYITIYDEWGKRKLAQFESLGLKTEVLWTRPPESKGLSGSDIRKCMALGEKWEHWVPPATAALMKEWRIPERLRDAYTHPSPA